jgi:IstB-like ATP binding protein
VFGLVLPHSPADAASRWAPAPQLDQTIADAAARNRSVAETLESLVDFELESRNSRSIERRFQLSRLHAQHSIDSFHFKHHKSRMDLKPRILRLLDLEFIAKSLGTHQE